IWRCRDCFVPHALCRGCMRQQHLHNPFHKIECWTGNHFRRAALWEVGAYFVVKHHKTEVHQRCRGLDRMIAKHEEQQQEVDRKQQVELAGHIFPAGNGMHSSCMRIAHTNGYHRLHVIVCSCDGEGSHFGDYVAAGLMPASFTRVNTLFTLQLLHFARLATLELQASVYQIHQLLVYIIADDLYHLLQRMLHIDRWLKKLKWAGFAHLTNKDPTKPAAGELGIFCSTCPQPSVNLPPGWEEKDPKIYGRSFVADGNFKADHLSSATRAEETLLYDGAGMMPKSEIYKEHIRKATETRTNVDFAFMQAIVRTNVDVRQRVTMIYDIGCQYSVHLRSRIDEMLSEHGMELLEIDHAIGMFHVHGHNDKCYFRFAPSFIPGLGMVDGEIMKTNWSVLNKAARAQRTATQVGQLEAMDNHTSDLNYKRTMKMAQTLERKYLVAR
ncbi:hypothetical protein BJ165DRAFT_1306841, partial [Panaeolus papilionaceus]